MQNFVKFEFFFRKSVSMSNYLNVTMEHFLFIICFIPNKAYLLMRQIHKHIKELLQSVGFFLHIPLKWGDIISKLDIGLKKIKLHFYRAKNCSNKNSKTEIRILDCRRREEKMADTPHPLKLSFQNNRKKYEKFCLWRN